MDLNTYTPACLAQKREYLRFEGKEATVAGWGALHVDGPRPSNPIAPREVQVRILTQKQCEKLDRMFQTVPNKTITIDNHTHQLYIGCIHNLARKNTYFFKFGPLSIMTMRLTYVLMLMGRMHVR